MHMRQHARPGDPAVTSSRVTERHSPYNLPTPIGRCRDVLPSTSTYSRCPLMSTTLETLDINSSFGSRVKQNTDSAIPEQAS